MRTKLASVALIMGLLASSMAPANAIFGLSKCEKIKKQILAYEKNEKPLIAEWSNYQGDWVWSYSQSDQVRIQRTFTKIVNLEVKMYSLEKNNPKCFSNTQNDYINRVYKLWKKYELENRFYPTNNNAAPTGYYMLISWDSIYNQ